MYLHIYGFGISEDFYDFQNFETRLTMDSVPVYVVVDKDGVWYEFPQDEVGFTIEKI